VSASVLSAARAAALLLCISVSSLQGQSVAEVQVAPQTLTLGVGQKQTIFAAAFDRSGNLISNAKFTFWTSDSSIARVQTDGTVTGVKPGLAKIEARTQGRRASLAVLVGDAAPGNAGHGIAVLTLQPASLRLVLGETAKLEPHALKDDGTPADIGRVIWKSLRPDVVAVDSTGALLARGTGRSIIQAALPSGMVATAPVEVEAVDLALSQPKVLVGPGEFDTLALLVPSQSNRVMTEGVVWQSTDTNVARIGPTGIVQGVAPGSAEIVAWLAGQERRAAVVVHKPVRAIVVTPRASGGSIVLPLDKKHKFTIAAEAVDSTPIPEVAIGWEVGDSSIATFDRASSELTAKAIGTTSLTARVAGFPPATWAIQVVPGAVRMDRTRFALSPGEHTSLKATLADESGKPAGSSTELTWKSDHPEVATVDQQGAVEARGFGRAKISASTSWGATADADAFVVGDMLAASNRGGKLGIYQALASQPDSLKRILADSGVNMDPVLSPDRTRIAFSSNRGSTEGNYDVYVMDADGSNIRRLTTAPGSDGQPAWMPDGTRLVFTGTRNGVPQIYTISADSADAAPVALTTSAGGNQNPAVSPDGRTIAFVSIRDGAPRIYRMGVDGSGQARANTGTLREGSPEFFSNGDLLFGVEKKKGSREWRVMRMPEGAAPVALFETEQPVVSLSPSRDGERIVFVTGRDGGKGRIEYRVWLRGLALGAQPIQLKLRQDEQFPSASF
jgi:Tol biopolymer transport system component/uncharacterized protein YjdB